MLKFLTCCFIGHRKIEYSLELELKLTELIENLIVEFNVGIFLFGSRSEFNDLCYRVVTKLKEKYPYIKRIYVRAEYNYDDNTMDYLLKDYEQTYFPKQIVKAGKYSYVERNLIMINQSEYCVFYYDKYYRVSNKSGTNIAFNYATKLNKKVFNILNLI